MKTSSTFVILDLKDGRKAVSKIVDDHKFKIPVTIEGYVTGQWSRDDGVSIEFQVEVTSHKLGKPIPHYCGCIGCRKPKVKK
jgi:hypothetical protein